ncbi:hypothetical protein ACXN5S_17770 [Pseudoroseicyclus sp. H15]
MHEIFDTLNRLSDELDRMPVKDMPERLVTEILEQGGHFPRADFKALETGEVRAMAQFHIHELTATAPTPMQAADLWRCVARTAIGGYEAPADPGDLVRLRAQLRWLAVTPVVALPMAARWDWANLVIAISNDAANRLTAGRVLAGAGVAA